MKNSVGFPKLETKALLHSQKDKKQLSFNCYSCHLLSTRGMSQIWNLIRDTTWKQQKNERNQHGSIKAGIKIEIVIF